MLCYSLDKAQIFIYSQPANHIDYADDFVNNELITSNYFEIRRMSFNIFYHC